MTKNMYLIGLGWFCIKILYRIEIVVIALVFLCMILVHVQTTK
jgi:hypothetical protein